MSNWLKKIEKSGYSLQDAVTCKLEHLQTVNSRIPII